MPSGLCLLSENNNRHTFCWLNSILLAWLASSSDALAFFSLASSVLHTQSSRKPLLSSHHQPGPWTLLADFAHTGSRRRLSFLNLLAWNADSTLLHLSSMDTGFLSRSADRVAKWLRGSLWDRQHPTLPEASRGP